MPQFGASPTIVTDDTKTFILQAYSAGFTYDRHLRSSKYFYGTHVNILMLSKVASANCSLIKCDGAIKYLEKLSLDHVNGESTQGAVVADGELRSML